MHKAHIDVHGSTLYSIQYTLLAIQNRKYYNTPQNLFYVFVKSFSFVFHEQRDQTSRIIKRKKKQNHVPAWTGTKRKINAQRKISDRGAS